VLVAGVPAAGVAVAGVALAGAVLIAGGAGADLLASVLCSGLREQAAQSNSTVTTAVRQRMRMTPPSYTWDEPFDREQARPSVHSRYPGVTGRPGMPPRAGAVNNRHARTRQFAATAQAETRR